MVKIDINGNTVSRNEKYLKAILRNMTSGIYSIDGYRMFMVETGTGGCIRFYESDEPFYSNMVMDKMTCSHNG